ncbi:MAG TPA: TetR/AcrR family transcriptional regulator [Bacillota bacterium]|nr:TetR/AcrR family transcriptional regulator [Bacillota bacterium]
MPRKNIPDAKNRILQAAIKVFAEKSFEGARIDEVASEAGVPKSLIYYHFKSKDEILDTVIQAFLKDYTQLLQIAEGDTHQSKAERMSSRMPDHYQEFFLRNADIVRIIFIDSLKKASTSPVIFKVLEALIEADKALSQTGKSENYDQNERLVAEFFTNIIPNFAYLCFADTWVNYFNMNRDQFNHLFLKAIIATHGAYHKYHD